MPYCYYKEEHSFIEAVTSLLPTFGDIIFPDELLFLSYAIAFFTSESIGSCTGRSPLWYALSEELLSGGIFKGHCKKSFQISSTSFFCYY